MRKGMWEVLREGKKTGVGKKERKTGRKRALELQSGISGKKKRKDEPCIGSEVNDSSDTFSSVDG